MLANIFCSRRSKAKFFYYIDCLFFKNRDKILFVVKDRTYFSGNLRVTLEAYLKNKNEQQRLFVYKDGICSSKIKEELVSLNVTVLDRFTLYTIWHILTSGTIVLSHNPRDVHLSKKYKNRNIINLWHGVSIKNIELLMPNVEEGKLKLLQNNSKLYDMLIASSDEDKKTNQKAFGVTADKVKITGLPRYALLKDDYVLSSVLQDEENAIKKIKVNKKLILYAPTFRENNQSAIEQLSENEWRLLEEFAKKNDVVFGIRPHPYDLMQLPNILDNNPYFYLFEASKFTEVNIILKHTDILIVDYSSIWIDYLLLNRPIVGFAKDYNEYFKKERGFIYDFKAVFPSIFSRNIDCLISIIESELDKESAVIYKNTIELFHKYSLEYNYSQNIYEEIEIIRKLNYIEPLV